MKRVKRSNPGEDTSSVKNVSLLLRADTLPRVRARMFDDGFSYVNDLVQVLLVLWTRGSVSKKLKQEIYLWPASEGPYPWSFTLKAREDILTAAVKTDPGESLSGVSELVRFLLEAYADGRVDLCLKKGREKGAP